MKEVKDVEQVRQSCLINQSGHWGRRTKGEEIQEVKQIKELEEVKELYQVERVTEVEDVNEFDESKR